MSQTNTYLSVREQEEIFKQIRGIKQSLPWRQQFWVSNGDKAAGLALMGTSLTFWRAGFRGFGLSKFSRARLSTCLFSMASSAQGTCLHSLWVRSTLDEYFRDESMIQYGIKSLLCHQVGLTLCFIASIGSTFGMAQYSSMIPVPHKFLHKEHRVQVFKYALAQLKPHRRSLAIAVLTSSAFVTVVGFLEYNQSRQMLAMINRKSLIYRE